MNIINEPVKHSVFGQGAVIRQEEDRIYIQFSGQDEIKKFVYPDAFELYLEFDHSNLQTAVMDDLRDKKVIKSAENARKQQQNADNAKSRIAEKKTLAMQDKKASRRNKKK